MKFWKWKIQTLPLPLLWGDDMDINTYLNLIPTNNFRKPKYMGFVDAVLTHMISLGCTSESIKNAFDVKNAAGDQLDIIGELVGVKRVLSVVPSVGSSELDDDEYRLAISLKVAKNEWDGTNEGMVKAYKEVLGDQYNISVVDNQDMSISVNFGSDLSMRSAEILANNHLLLIPAGVRCRIVIYSDDVPSVDYIATEVCGIDIYAYASMNQIHEPMTVSDIEDMYVEDIEAMSVRLLEK